MEHVLSEDIAQVLSDDLPWERLSGKCVAVTGANGMLASFLVKTLLALNDRLEAPVKVVGLVRNVEKARERFSEHAGDTRLELRKWSVDDSDLRLPECNVMVHAASIPRADSRNPVDVVAPNVVGTWNLLDYCRRGCPHFEDFLFFSSGAVYGDDHRDDAPVAEGQSFPIDPMNHLSCYAESKRMGENLCASFAVQYGMSAKVLRYAHTYGPEMDLDGDPRSFVYFVRCALRGEDIELRTDGRMPRYFCYVTDATSALFRILFFGRSGEAYNVGNEDGRIAICDLAAKIAGMATPAVKVRQTARGARSATSFIPQRYTLHPDTGKLKALGFRPRVSVEDGFGRVLRYHGHGRQA